MDYLELLRHSFNKDEADSKLEYLSDNIFDFTTYDSEMSELFCEKALDVCNAIQERKTFEFIENKENYIWFLTMCNMPFFSDKLDWGTSIRGAWWDIYVEKPFVINSFGLWKGSEQLLELPLNKSEWGNFISAMNEFVSE